MYNILSQRHTPKAQGTSTTIMPIAVCCSTVEVKYRKKAGGIKIVMDARIHISDIDLHLNEISRKVNFKEFVSVKMINIHHNEIHSVDSDSSDYEGETDQGLDIPTGLTQ